MDLRELESYRLSDAVKFNDQLNPRIWGPDEQMLPEVREKLLAIADDFREFLGIDVEVKDITISGSNAAYTYTPHSDIDLHLVADLPRADESDVYRELFDAKKYAYNDQHDFKIGGYDVELYVQDVRKPHHSQGIYSIQDDQWLSVPRRRRPEIDDISVRSKYEDLGHRIESAIKSGSLEQMSAMAEKLRNFRQAGLDQHGEFGPENLAFKILRSNGTLDRLRQARLQAKDSQMSLAERKKKKSSKKKFRYGAFGGYYFPGYGYYGQTGAAEADSGGGDGGGESVRESQGESQQDTIERFARSCADFLGIQQCPVIKLRRDPQWSRINGTFGRYVADPEARIELATHGRHIVDILRTLAHEMTHARQDERTGLPDDAGETGSEFEDEANALAGRIMRHWAESEPEMFQGANLEERDSGQEPQPGDPIDWPEGTVHVKVSDVYDWYKLGQKISDLEHARSSEFGKGVPETILVFNNEPQEEEMLDRLGQLGLSVHDVDPGEQPGEEVDEGLKSKLGAAAAAACIAGTPGCATTDALRTVQTVGRTAQTMKDMRADDAREELTTAIKDMLRRGTGTRESVEGPAPRLDDPIVNYDIPYTAIARPERLQRARRFGSISHYERAGSPVAIISVPVSRERAFVDDMRRQGVSVQPSRVMEASGYIPTEREKDDPRFSMALTQDVRPGETGRQANKLGLKTDSQGRPALLMKRLSNLLESVKAGDDHDIGEQKAKSKFSWADYNDLPMDSAMDLAEGYFLHDGNLLETNSPESTQYFRDLFAMSSNPVTGSEYLITLLILINDRVSVAQDTVNAKVLAKHGSNEYTLELSDGRVVRFPWQVLRNQAIYNTWFFDDTTQYDKFRSALSLKFSVDLPGIGTSDNITESQDLFEVKMSPGELQKWAKSSEAEGIQAGFEAELIFRDMGRDSDDENESEPDYNQDRRARDIESVVDFFQGGENGISRNQANRLRNDLYEQFHEWISDTFYDRVWNERKYSEWVDDNIWPDEQDEWRERAQAELGLENESELTPEQTDNIEKTAQQMFREEAEEQWESQGSWYNQAEEEMMDEFRDENDEAEWLEDTYPYMSDVENSFGLSWPYYTEGSSGPEGGGRDPQDLAQSLSSALGGAEVKVGSGYHGVSRRPGRWIIEPDSSLKPDDYEDTGLEIVSPPMPLPQALQALKTVLDWAQSNEGDAYTNDSTGLHMGVSIPHKGGDVDYVKLILFMGDQYVLDQFGRAANSYCRSALKKLQDVQRQRRRGLSEQERQSQTGAEKTAAAMDLMRKNLVELAARYVQDGVGTGKYTSAHIKPGYIEFRSPGGDYLSMDSRDEEALGNTMLRFARAMQIAGRPDLERKEYSKKLYKLLSGFRGAEISRPGQDTRYKTKIEFEDQTDAMDLFARYASGQITPDELKKQWAEQVLAREQPKKPGGEKYEIYDKDTGEVLDVISGDNEADRSLAATYALEKFSGQGINFGIRKQQQEPEPKPSRRAEVAKRIAEKPTLWTVRAGDREMFVMAANVADAQRAAQQRDAYFDRNRSYISARPATREEQARYRQQQADNAQDSEQVQQRVAPGRGRYRVTWTEFRNGQETPDSINQEGDSPEDAVARIRRALELQGRTPANMRAELTDAGTPSGAADTETQREYQIYHRSTNQPVVAFRAADDEAALARLEQYRQQHPSLDVGVRTGGVTSATRNQVPQGEFTGNWQIRDGQGRVLHTFGGIGNSQSDANRHAAGWLGRNRPDLIGQEVEVVPEMRE